MLDWILDAIISGIGVLTGKARKRRADGQAGPQHTTG
jgi:hypothetical protein